jgi:two-component sensor histidine kinase
VADAPASGAGRNFSVAPWIHFIQGRVEILNAAEHPYRTSDLDEAVGLAQPSARRTSFRRLLVLLVLGVALPLTGLAAASVWHAARNERARFETQLVANARSLALAVDRELGQAAAIVRTLAASARLPAGELPEFHAHAARIAPPGATILLFDAAGRRIVSSAEPFGGAALDGVPSANIPHLRRTLDAEGIQISDLFFGARSRAPLLMVSQRVLVRGAPHVLVMAVPTRRLLDLLRGQDLPAGWVSAVLDAAHQVVARTEGDEAEWVGRAARPTVRALLASGDAGVVPAEPRLDGVLSVTAVARAPDSGLAALIAAPTLAPWRQALVTVGPALLVGLLLALGGLLLALWLGRRLIRALDALAAGNAPRPSGIAEVDAVGERLAAAGRARDEAMETLRRSEERHRITIEAFAGGVYECLVPENRTIRSPGHLSIVGEASDTPDPDWWISRIHPADLPMWDAARARLFAGEVSSVELEYRVRHAAGHWVWIWHRSIAQRDARGAVQRMIGSVIDITAEREVQTQRDLLAREMDHRVKNSFAVLAGLVSAAAADHPEAADFAEDVRGRLVALSTAHDLARGSQDRAPTLRRLLARLARPYGGAVLVEGADAALEPEMATPLALVLHEWFTNALKHGALSRPSGRVAIRVGAAGPGVVGLDWTESGGPRVEPPAGRGFGSVLVSGSVEQQLEGHLEEDWAPGGLRLRFTWPAELLPEPAPQAA